MTALKRRTTIDGLRGKEAVIEIVPNGANKYRLHARPYGNAVLFNTVAESEQMRLGNVTTVDGKLVLNLTDIS